MKDFKVGDVVDLKTFDECCDILYGRNNVKHILGIEKEYFCNHRLNLTISQTDYGYITFKEVDFSVLKSLLSPKNKYIVEIHGKVV